MDILRDRDMDTEKMQRSMAVVGKIYERLYKHGLSAQMLSLENIELTDVELVPANREVWYADNRLLVDVLTWLQKEGAIYMKAIENDPSIGISHAEEVQLSAKGIELLHQFDLTQVEEEDKTDEKPQSSSYAAGYYTKFGEFIGAALGGFTKVIAQ